MADKLNDAAEILARAGMLAAGYHERKGERRRRRDAWAHGRGAKAGGATAGPLGKGPGRRGRRKDGAALGPRRKRAGGARRVLRYARGLSWGMLAEKMAVGDPLVKEATTRQAERMALELAGVDPTPPEVLLSERVASPWVLVELQEALFAA
jgi:hypothetical protein